MRENFTRCLALSRVSEGGYSNNPHDDGGPTMKGITIAVFRGFMRNNRLGIDDLKAISDETVAAIYKQNYWDKVKGDELPKGVDYTAFDYALNSGPGRPAKAIQRIVGAEVDGAIGDKTLAKIKTVDPRFLITEVNAERLAFMKRAKNSKGELLWTTFGVGWQRRVDAVLRDSLAMLTGAVPPQSAPIPRPRPTEPVQPPNDAPAPETRGPDKEPATGLLAALWALLTAWLRRPRRY